MYVKEKTLSVQNYKKGEIIYYHYCSIKILKQPNKLLNRKLQNYSLSKNLTIYLKHQQV